MTDSNGLTESDYRMLEQSWIPRQFADDAGIRRVSSIKGTQIVGCNRPRNYAGIIFAHVFPEETQAREYLLRRDSPEIDPKSDGSFREKRKYPCAPGGRKHLYFPHGIKPEALKDASIHVVIAEGEEKTLALYLLAQWDTSGLRFLHVGLSGVWNWRGVNASRNRGRKVKCEQSKARFLI